MDELSNQVSTVRQASREVVRELGFLEDRVYDLGITHSQCHALLEVERQSLLTLQDLSILLKLDKSTMSRTVSSLAKKGLLRIERGSQDRRRKPLSLTLPGRKLAAQIHKNSNRQVAGALSILNHGERELAINGLSIYAKALARTRQDLHHEIRLIKKSDNPDVARIIRTVMPEFGARGHGFAITDSEVSKMHGAYSNSRSAYFVLVHRGHISGGGGIAPLEGGEDGICELRKMYFLSGVRGLGYGQKMLDHCLRAALDRGYQRCYLETLENMAQAKKLYEKNGFKKLSKPMGDTGHFRCNAWYMKTLKR